MERMQNMTDIWEKRLVPGSEERKTRRKKTRRTARGDGHMHHLCPSEDSFKVAEKLPSQDLASLNPSVLGPRRRHAGRSVASLFGERRHVLLLAGLSLFSEVI
ncbi:hypothetical protein DPEC_G00238950 [Dallia pectoralis]|uniref:Uncharacterized protein n=1 Tax=Dallia pectoralis TaxID=75939 RepID=A0ACC2FZ82_DALPE|nr:hypothetical protein DPEC_G00238950 [Dallia pectoralis]